MSITRTFTPDELEELGLPEDYVYSELVEKKRWAVVHHLVFRAEEDGPLWRVKYYEPATEDQEGQGIWAYGDEPPTVKGIQVEPYQVEVTRYRPVVDPSVSVDGLAPNI